MPANVPVVLCDAREPSPREGDVGAAGGGRAPPGPDGRRASSAAVEPIGGGAGILRRSERARAGARFFVETLGCPKNAVDSDKVVASPPGRRAARPPTAPTTPTSSWSTPARSSRRRARSRSTPSSPSATPARPGAQLVVTGCMAERYGDELAAALPEVDAVVGFAGEGSLGDRRSALGGAAAQAHRRARPARAAPRRRRRCRGPT